MEDAEAQEAGPGPDEPARLRGRDALRLHLLLVAGLTLCAGAFAVELWRAVGGHAFSWLYVFEWPFFAGFALYMWWNLLQGRGSDRPRDKGRGPVAAGPDPPVDEKLEAWNRYVRDLEASEKTEPGPG